jgi:hypothetical protein
MTFGAFIERARDEQVPAVEATEHLSNEQRMWLALMAGPATAASSLSPTP